MLPLPLTPIAARVGKPALLYFALACFIAVQLLALALCRSPRPAPGAAASAGWWTALVAIFVLQGVGRAMWESTNKALVADLFEGQTDAAFANGVMQLGIASAFGFFAFPLMSIPAAASIALAFAGIAVVGLASVDVGRAPPRKYLESDD